MFVCLGEKSQTETKKSDKNKKEKLAFAMNIYLLHRDMAAVLSHYPKPFDEESGYKALRFFYLAVLKRLPRIEDFKVSSKYKPLIPIDFQDMTPDQPKIVYYNLSECSLAQISVTADSVSLAKPIAIYHFIKNKLNVTPENNFSLSEYEQIQNFSRMKHVCFISCMVWDPKSILKMQQQYYIDRISLTLDDFLVVGKRKALDASVCAHPTQLDEWKKTSMSVNEIFSHIIRSHIKNCLHKDVDEDGKIRQKHLQTIEMAEEKGSSLDLISWPLCLDVPQGTLPEEMKKLRAKWKIQHPYFAGLEYRNMTTPCLDTNEYPVIPSSSLTHLPTDVIELYNAYSSAMPLLNTPASVPKIRSWVMQTVRQLFQIYNENHYNTAPFSCISLCTIPELIKFCAEFPLPRLSLTEIREGKKIPIFKYAHALPSGLLLTCHNSFSKNFSQSNLNMGLYLLSYMKLWHVFPTPASKKPNGTPKKKPTLPTNRMQFQKKDSKPYSAKDLEKSYFVLTVGFPEPLYKKFSEEHKMDKFTDGPLPVFQTLEPNKISYSIYEIFRKFQPALPVKHLILKHIDKIHAFLRLISSIYQVSYEMLFDVSLAEPAYEMVR